MNGERKDETPRQDAGVESQEQPVADERPVRVRVRGEVRGGVGGLGGLGGNGTWYP